MSSNYEWTVDKRYIKLQVFQGERALNNLLSEFDIKAKINFNTTESVSGGVNEANIVINGMLPEKMAYLATTSTQWSKNAVRNNITIDAGYEKAGHAIIFSGVITDAVPKMDVANYMITIKALSGFASMLNDVKSYNFPGEVKASEIANTFAKDLKFVFVNGLNKDVIVSNYFLLNQSITSHIRFLAMQTGLDVYVDNNRLYIKERDKVIDEKNVFKVNASNMIGSPIPTSQGVDVNIWLNPAVKTGQILQIESAMLDTLNSQNYVIQTISHTGDTKSNQWITHLKCFRRDLYA